MLDINTFRVVVQNAPLFAIDLVVVNEVKQLLVGKRLNAPAKDYWFVPGGRVFKNETLADAFMRISKAELGTAYQLDQAHLLGLFEHFYSDSIFADDISTHYINAAHFVTVKSTNLNLPCGEQHNAYRWVKLAEVEFDNSIHRYSKVFMPKLLNLLSQNILK